MPIHLHVDEGLGLAEVVFAGRVTDDEIRQAVAAYVSPEYAHLPLGLFEFGASAEVDLDSEVMRSAVGRIAEVVDPGLKHGRLAIVAEREEFFGLARRYQIMRDPSPVEVKVFGRRRDALRWLGLPLGDESE